MIRVHHPRRGTSHPDRTRAFRPSLDGLEGRMLLYSTTGGSWIHPVRVTYSIVADGTSIGGIPSNLRQKLGAYANWEQQIQKAAAVWEAVAGINLVQVPDDGSPIGSGGDQQGDPDFGDIRIGGMSQPGNQLAFAYAPPPFNGATLRRRHLLQYRPVVADQRHDLRPHDRRHPRVRPRPGHGPLGDHHGRHVCRLQFRKQTLTSDDTTGLHTIYGGRQSDSFDASASNNSYTAATNHHLLFRRLRPDRAGQSRHQLRKRRRLVQGRRPPRAGPMTVRMQSSRLSSLVPRLTVYNANLKTVGTATGEQLTATR